MDDGEPISTNVISKGKSEIDMQKVRYFNLHRISLILCHSIEEKNIRIRFWVPAD